MKYILELKVPAVVFMTKKPWMLLPMESRVMQEKIIQ